jgi:hypothetical protein
VLLANPHLLWMLLLLFWGAAGTCVLAIPAVLPLQRYVLCMLAAAVFHAQGSSFAIWTPPMLHSHCKRLLLLLVMMMLVCCSLSHGVLEAAGQVLCVIGNAAG